MSYLSERIEELRDLLEDMEDLYEDEWDDIDEDDFEEWSKWATAHGPVKGRQKKSGGTEWYKGAYQIVHDRELSNGVEGHWIRVNGRPIFVVDKAAKVPKKLRKSKAGQEKFPVTKSGRYRKNRKRSRAAKLAHQR